MIELGIVFALLSGICNGLFTTPMKLIPRWKWENIWLVFIVISCLIAPIALVTCTVPDFPHVFSNAPPRALACALLFGFAWGFGAIFFGQSVSRLGVSLANTLVIGLSSALRVKRTPTLILPYSWKERKANRSRSKVWSLEFHSRSKATRFLM